jgi:aldose 1-epimerase
MSPVQIRAGSTVATIDPDVGFNLHSLVIDGFDYVHAASGWRDDPMYNGIPILFPWPNRIAGARFSWDGRDQVLPVTEPATGASIHGYAFAAPWQVVDAGPDRATGEFLLRGDAPATPWPGDAILRVTYRVEPAALIATCEVRNLDDHDLPFGLGFHPYLRVPGPFDQWLLQVDAGMAWPLSGMVPTGPARPVPDDVDFRRPRRLGDQHLDDALTGLPEAPALTRRAALLSMAATLAVSSDPDFRDYVVFTPSSRDAVAIEPYTCSTDAVHLQARGIEAGWRVLAPGQTHTSSWRLDAE